MGSCMDKGAGLVFWTKSGGNGLVTKNDQRCDLCFGQQALGASISIMPSWLFLFPASVRVSLVLIPILLRSAVQVSDIVLNMS